MRCSVHRSAVLPLTLSVSRNSMKPTAVLIAVIAVLSSPKDVLSDSVEFFYYSDSGPPFLHKELYL
jgi:hypothetical protein